MYGIILSMFSFVKGQIDFAHKINLPSEPQEEYHKHMHPFCEVLYFVGGDVTYTVESKFRKLQPGDIVFIAPGSFHFATVNLDEGPYERYVLKFPEVSIPEHLRNSFIAGDPFYTGSQDCEKVVTSLDYCFENLTEKDVFNIFLGKITELLIWMNKSALVAKEDVNSLIDKIIDYINDHISEPITLKSLSNDLMYSESYISNEFHKNMHISIMMYVRLKKIVYANMLIQSGMKKGVAAEKAGFMNYSTFFRAYRKMFGKYGELLDADEDKPFSDDEDDEGGGD